MKPPRYPIDVTLDECCDHREVSAMQRAQMIEGGRGERRHEKDHSVKLRLQGGEEKVRGKEGTRKTAA